MSALWPQEWRSVKHQNPSGVTMPETFKIRTVIANGGHYLGTSQVVMTTTFGQPLAFEAIGAQDTLHSAGFWAGAPLANDLIFRGNFN